MSKKGKTTSYTESAVDALSTAGCAASDLSDEMQSWRDNMQDKLSHTEKFSLVEECCDALENAEMTERCERVEELLGALSDGSPEKPACAEHVRGSRCPNAARCGWEGAPKRPHEMTVVRFDPPREIVGKRRVAVRVGKVGYSLYDVGDEEKFEAAAKLADARFERFAASASIPPVNGTYEPAVAPIDAFSEEHLPKVVYTQFSGYKHTSRADRLGNAIGAAQAALDVLRNVIDGLSPEDRAACDNDDDSRLQDLIDALDEIEQAISDIEGVEFPGMFG
jgi:hypothetical protein